MDARAVGVEVGNLVTTALHSIKPSAEDKQAAIGYGIDIARCAGTAAMETDPAAKAKILAEGQGYADALSMMVARYEVKTVIEGRKVASELLATGLRLLFAALI